MGMLPYDQDGELRNNDGDVIASLIPISVWPVNPSVTPSGLAYDHDAECPRLFRDDFAGENLRLFIDGVRYTVVAVQDNVYFPHLALRLRKIKSTGA